MSKNCNDDILSISEKNDFLADAELKISQPRYKVMFTLALYSGFRHGELLGLKWDDIDFDTCVITINRIALYTKDKVELTGCLTKLLNYTRTGLYYILDNINSNYIQKNVFEV